MQVGFEFPGLRRVQPKGGRGFLFVVFFLGGCPGRDAVPGKCGSKKATGCQIANIPRFQPALVVVVVVLVGKVGESLRTGFLRHSFHQRREIGVHAPRGHAQIAVFPPGESLRVGSEHAGGRHAGHVSGARCLSVAVLVFVENGNAPFGIDLGQIESRRKTRKAAAHNDHVLVELLAPPPGHVGNEGRQRRGGLRWVVGRRGRRMGEPAAGAAFAIL
mmetsp:Transcript_24697/g.58406  ORF Transcript_24697/g.58406 Transcript_24697/m.58406 type:complete len:217 (-) Transcript_24697:418-1068(-)